MPARPRIVAFDIIGTTFSMEPMRSELVGLGLAPLSLELLYTTGLRDMFALACTGAFASFQSVLGGCLDALLAQESLSASAEQKQAVLGLMKTLPPHTDAEAAFQTLSDAGIRIVALSNGSADTTTGLLEAAGLARFVDRVLSVEDVELSKPRPEVYRYAARVTDVAPKDMALVATHPWDIHGAATVGLTGAYVARGQPYSPVLKQPDVRGETLLDVARALVALPS